MIEKKRKQEQEQYEIAKKWLEDNGEFKIITYKKTEKFKVIFSNKQSKTEQTGEDLLRLTIQIYNDVNQ